MDNSPNPYGTPNTPVDPHSPYAHNPHAKTSGLAIASMVCGIIGVLIFQIVLGPLAVIFGHVSLSSIKKNPSLIKGKGMAIAGLVCGYVAIALVVVAFLFFASAVNSLR